MTSPSADRPLPLPKSDLVALEAELDRLIGSPNQIDTANLAEDLLDFLARSGRLLPSSAEHREVTWGVRKHPRGAVATVGLGEGAEWLARRAARAGDGHVVQQVKQYFTDGSVLVGPWVAVEGSQP